jgi:nucleoside-diphosphate-sugar epimerase
MMQTALVLGITGGFGGHVAEALAANGWRLRALLRNNSRLPERFRNVEVIAGDASRIDDVRRAAEGTQLIVYGVNAPYPQWDKTVLPWLDVTAQVAEAQRLIIVFPGNVYNFDPADGPLFDERALMQALTPKGRLRQSMEARLQRASENGARVLILRAGNFIGAHAHSTWLRYLIKPTRHGYALSAAGPRDLKHAWAYLPDVAATLVKLLEQSAALPAFGVFHFKGYQASFDDFAAAMQTASGKAVVMKNFPWWLLRLAASFSPWIRSLFEMRYLWEQEVHLDETRLAATLAMPIPHTPLPMALLQSGLVARG